MPVDFNAQTMFAKNCAFREKHISYVKRKLLKIELSNAYDHKNVNQVDFKKNKPKLMILA